MTDTKLRILVADDHAIFRKALRSMLETDPNLIVVAEAGDGQEALDRADETHPDIVCMDVSMPIMNGIDATRLLTASQPLVKVIGLSAYSDRKFILDMLGAGATGYVTKSSAGRELLPAIHQVSKNETYLCTEAKGVVPGETRH